MRKLLSIVASVVMVAGMMLAAVAPASAAVPNDWRRYCNTTSNSSHFPTYYFSKHKDDLGTNIEAVRGTIHVGNNSTTGYPCIQSGSDTGNAYVWAANLQGNGGDIIQWGMCRIGSQGQWKFCYTAFDNQGGAGVVYVNQPLNGTPPPIVAGHDYYFQITGCNDNGVDQWCLYVDDLDALSGDPTYRVGRSWDFNGGILAWWGFEVQDAGGVLGYRSSSGDGNMYITNMMYKRHDTNQWVYRQQSSCYGRDITGTAWLRFKCATDDRTYTNDTIRAWTIPSNYN